MTMNTRIDCLAEMNHIPINPVEDVEESVGSEGKEIVSSDSFSVSGSREHEELWHDGDGFQIDRERPHNL